MSGFIELCDIVDGPWFVIRAERNHIVAWDGAKGFRTYHQVEPGVYELVNDEQISTPLHGTISMLATARGIAQGFIAAECA